MISQLDRAGVGRRCCVRGCWPSPGRSASPMPTLTTPFRSSPQQRLSRCSMSTARDTEARTWSCPPTHHTGSRSEPRRARWCSFDPEVRARPFRARARGPLRVDCQPSAYFHRSTSAGHHRRRGDRAPGLRTYSYDPTRRFDSTQLGMAAKPDYPSGYLRQMLYPFTRGGGCTLTPTTAGPDAQASDSDPGSKYRCQPAIIAIWR